MRAIIGGEECDVRSHSKEWKMRLQTKNWYVNVEAEKSN